MFCIVLTIEAYKNKYSAITSCQDSDYKDRASFFDFFQIFLLIFWLFLQLPLWRQMFLGFEIEKGIDFYEL